MAEKRKKYIEMFGSFTEPFNYKPKQAEQEATLYAPPLRMVQPSSSPYTAYACGAQRALLPVAVGAMNIHDVCDRQTSDSIIA